MADRVVAAVCIAVPTVPIEPVVELRLTVPEVSVTAPDRVMEPEPLVLTLMVPVVPVDTLAFMAMEALPALVAREMMPLPDMLRPGLMVNALPEVMEMLPETSLMVPYVTVPTALIVSDLVPSVIVCPVDVKVPPLLNCRL